MTAQDISYPHAINGTLTTNGNLPNFAIPEPPKRSISISQLDFGFTVNVGCQTVAFETPEKLTKNLLTYLKDPQGFEKNWFKKKKIF